MATRLLHPLCDLVQAKASHRADPIGEPVRSFRCLSDHPATLTRNDIRHAPDLPTIPLAAA
ncbi:hypothetical protein [Rhodococcus sp. NCIMB 12038]|jgi:hypothetical protein|uniref:hypothetical protein n=1 Tax=Rhodococcus sp. NCIMB 12038 TaxID=933800 RepID=UPI00117BDC96|nr:hypothetical protein [Rhodococcus sp. NCIMB 12038]